MQVFPGGDAEQIADQLDSPRGDILLKTIQTADPEKKDAALFICDHVHQHRFIFKQRIGLGKAAALFHVAEDRPVAPDVVAFDGNASFENKPHVFADVPGIQDRLILFIGFLFRGKCRQGGGDLCVVHSAKERDLPNIINLHYASSSSLIRVAMATYRS